MQGLEGKGVNHPERKHPLVTDLRKNLLFAAVRVSLPLREDCHLSMALNAGSKSRVQGMDVRANCVFFLF